MLQLLLLLLRQRTCLRHFAEQGIDRVHIHVLYPLTVKQPCRKLTQHANTQTHYPLVGARTMPCLVVY
jgi:hypothetical protein